MDVARRNARRRSWFEFDAGVSLNLCAADANVEVNIGLEKPLSLQWSHTWAMDTVRAARACGRVPGARGAPNKRTFE